MEPQFFLKVIQVITAILVIIAILAQRSEASVGGVFGGGDMSETGGIKRRGSEKVMFIGTIILSSIFVLSVILAVVIN